MSEEMNEELNEQLDQAPGWDANGPICLGADTLLTALAFTPDPELSPIETPNGRVGFPK
ncbi:suppressor of fused domain protein [Paenibacillus sp. FSL H7-0326]|uniref:suppressor of fused domain protein n=1 Tax=Paenibacillus sp. FSL H7-0326 TaxID=1921144 RepID=UPI00117C973A|nr:suppressor of fused domain protein [Paenibacillus sp. FSL H7-0326]